MINIAILLGDAELDLQTDSYEFIAKNLTEFEEVSDEDFKLLMRYRNRLRYSENIFIFEKPQDQNGIVSKAVSVCLKYLHEEQEKSKKEEEKRKKAAEKRNSQTLERKKKQLEKLKKEFGEE